MNPPSPPQSRTRRRRERQFTCFSQLPPELRLMVWEASLAPRNLEARVVALKLRPWLLQQLNIFYLYKSVSDAFEGDAFRNYMVNPQFKARTFALNINMPSYAVGRCRQVLLYRERADIGPIKAASTTQRVGQVLLAIGTLACKEKAPLFGTSEWMILALDDPRLLTTLCHYEATEGMYTRELLYIARDEMKTPPNMSDGKVCESYFRYIINEIAETFKQGMIKDWLRYHRRPASEVEVQKAIATMPRVQLAVDFRTTRCWGNIKEWKWEGNPGWGNGSSGRLDIF
ncbi:hypothetical protein GGR51DRAFT_556138 [Nemania sp. FL0031]|nr:hypothetical protein GGR51DRAFT_556138 [Nemania sp. FL0031]